MSESSSGGIGLSTVLGVIFIVLKLVGTINWSWWWVLLPIYGPLGLAVVIFCVVLFAGLLD